MIRRHYELDGELDPEVVRRFADDIEGLRCKLMLSTAREDGSPAWVPAIAEQHLALAFSALESCKAHLKLCAAKIEQGE